MPLVCSAWAMMVLLSRESGWGTGAAGLLGGMGGRPGAWVGQRRQPEPWRSRRCCTGHVSGCSTSRGWQQPQ